MTSCPSLPTTKGFLRVQTLGQNQAKKDSWPPHMTGFDKHLTRVFQLSG